MLILALVLAAGGAACGAPPADPGQAAMQRGDYSEALRIWRQQAQAGDPEAQNAVGVMHYLGLGTPRAPERAAEWFLQAARARNPRAQFNLGLMYQNGYGVPHDLFQSYLWLYAADHAGHPRAPVYIAALGSLVTANLMSKAKSMAEPYLAESAGD